ncbi:UNVERIFIED_CONTAM: pilus assembly protein PilM, partial [Escherichia coli]
EQVFSADEATGGYHMSLVLSGYYKISLEDAEKHKRNPQKYEEHFQVLYPVAEKMAHLSQRFIQQYGKPVELVYLVGGTTVFPQFKDVFQKVLGIPVYQPFHPRLVTPVGIAMLSKEF